MSHAEYRDSGIPWVGRIPKGWDTVPLMTVLQESKVKNVGLTESNLLSLSFGRIIRKDIDAIGGLLPESFETYQIVEPNNLVFRFTDLQNDQRSLRSARVTERGIITSAYLSARPTGIDARYAEHLMRSYDVTKVFYGLGGGVRQSLKFSDVARLPVILPSVEEQHAIADYLDRETSRIDTLIEEQQQLIEMLRERRAAAIASALANLSGAMTRLKYVATIQTGITLSGEGDSTETEWPYLRVANVQAGYVDLGEIKTVRVPPERAVRSMLQSGDVLMTEGGDIDKLGRGALWCGDRPNMLHQNHIFAVRPNESLDSKFLAYWLDGPLARAYFRTTAKQTTNLAATNKWTVGNLPVAVPPIEDQRQAIDALDEQTAAIGSLIVETKRFIELARERRSALITAAVTGEIDVREVA
jgi:type I restriction enzyme S subunit